MKAGTAMDAARGRRGRLILATLAVLSVSLSAHLAQARAVILPAVTLDGPGEDIVGFGGVAMAEDGSGGAVYLKRVGGVAHVFVARFQGGQWQSPIRVDTEQPFAASSPRIGAADGGELIVVWATPFATKEGKPVYELVGSLLGRGGQAFGPAIIVDQNIEEATGTTPDLAVSSTGQADVVYRVVKPTNRSIPLLHPGDVAEEVRVAHFNGNRWSSLGAINRNPGVSMRPPTSSNAPQIAIGPTGNGIVVWQEPNIEGVARIWARRLFGSTLDYVLPVSAETYAGAPIGQDADAPGIAVSWLGQADVVYRQNAGPGSSLPGPRIYLNILPNGEATSGAAFLGANIADSTVPGGLSASIGPPSIDIDEKEDLRILYDSNGTPRVIEGDDHGLSGTLSLGAPFAGSEPLAASVMNPQGGGISAWPSADASGHPAVAVREDFPEGAVQTALLGGGAGGEVGELSVGRSGLGDGLVGFRQGPFGDAAIVVTETAAPPSELSLSAPKTWVRPAAATVSWEPASSADGPLQYSVVLDGHRHRVSPSAFSLRLSSRGLGSGRHSVQLLATGLSGQAALSRPSVLKVDGEPPTVKIRRSRGGSSVTVRVSDSDSGVAARSVSVNFGDGHGAHGRVRLVHRYARAGVYSVSVRSRDKVGNRGVVRQLVSVG